MPLTPKQLFDCLDQLAIPAVTHQHAAVFTVEESAQVTAGIEGGHTKNLFVKDKKGNYFLIVAETSARIELNRIHSLVGAKSRLSFANAQDLMQFLGVTPGSVNAFAPINDTGGRVAVVIDAALLSHDKINCHPLTNTMTTTISRQDLLRFLDHAGHRPLIAHLSAPQATHEFPALGKAG